MQSGRARVSSSQWILEYEPATAKNPDPLMGWTSCNDTLGQTRLFFDTLDDAESFAKQEELIYSVTPATHRKIKPRNFGDNFRYRPPEKDRHNGKKT